MGGWRPLPLLRHRRRLPCTLRLDASFALFLRENSFSDLHPLQCVRPCQKSRRPPAAALCAGTF